MLQKRLMLVLGLVIAISMVLTACGSTATPVPPTAAPVAQATATSVPVRHGGYLDEIDASIVDASSVVTQLQAGAIDIFAYGLSPADLPAIKAANLSYGTYMGLYYDILYNPAVCTDTSMLNPFSDRKIREATNYIYDRNYINQEIYNNGALPKFFPFMTDGPDYTALADVAAGLEAQYAYNLDKGKQIIATEMATLGATADANGKWQYKGKPVTLKFDIRNDGDGTRKPLGDYVATQLESVGFTVDRHYGKSSELSPDWIRSNPTDCKWLIYTAGWANTAIERDGKADFQSMYLPSSTQGISVFTANNPDPAFQKVGDDLANGKFSSADQRTQMMAQAMKLGLQDSLQVWLEDLHGFVPYTNKVQVATDMGAGVETSYIWPYTLRFKDQIGGSLKWATAILFTDPWNPVAGSNWTSDQGLVRAVSGNSVLYDPYTGLAWPVRMQKMDVTVKTGLSVFKTLDWVTLNTADKIAAPSDAWVDWDAKTQTFITVADAANAAANIAKVQAQAATLAGAVDLTTMVAPAAPAANATPALDKGGQALGKLATDLGTFYTQTTGKTVDVAGALTSADNISSIEDEVGKVAGITTGAADQQKEIASWAVGFVGGLDGSGYYQLGTTDYTTANEKMVWTYPADMFKTVKWQDGSPLTMGDFIMNIIENFDRAKPDSPIYDDTYVPTFQAFQQGFKGIKIDSTDPLVIEYYTDTYTPDAENNVPIGFAWPNYGFGEAPWSVIAAGNAAEADGQLAWSSDFATEKKVEWTSFIGGPSLDILTKELTTLAGNSTVPYAPTMGKYVTADEAKTRYANLQAWYTAHKHYWVGTGPYYLDSVNLTAKTLVLKNNLDYVDAADRFSQFSTPMIPDVKLDGPATVKVGDTATFTVTATFQGKPYPSTDVSKVTYLLFDSTGAVIGKGTATAGSSDGQWQVVLGADVTSKLTAGSNKITVVVAPIPVAQPTFVSMSFVTTP
jgi:hypothetical protein